VAGGPSAPLRDAARCQGVLGLRLARLACGKLDGPGPLECARMGRPRPTACCRLQHRWTSPLRSFGQLICIPAVPSAQIHDPARDGSGLLNEWERHRSHGLIPGRDGTNPYQRS
jgi:hypothetical protein